MQARRTKRKNCGGSWSDVNRGFALATRHSEARHRREVFKPLGAFETMFSQGTVLQLLLVSLTGTSLFAAYNTNTGNQFWLHPTMMTLVNPSFCTLNPKP